MKFGLSFIVAYSVVGTPAVAADNLAWSIFEGEAPGTLELGAGPPPDVTLVLRCRSAGEEISVLQLLMPDLPQIGSGERTASVLEAYGETEAVVAIGDPVWEEFLSGSPLRVDGTEYALSREEDRAKAKRFFERCRGQQGRGSVGGSES